jgi:glycosyltransferase involved in cell wall biosynthesis
MKIAVAAPTHLPARRANTLQVMKMTQALALLGHDVRLAVPGRPATPVSWDMLAEQYGLSLPFSVDWLPTQRSLRSYDYGLHVLGWARRQGAQLLYTRLPQAAAVAAVSGLPVILEAHDIPQGRMGIWLFRRFLSGRAARRLVVITRTLADDLSNRFGAPAGPPFTLVASDGVDLERFAGLPAPEQARRTLPLEIHGFTAGYTGHLYTGRGVNLILTLAASLPKINFLLVGGEPLDVERVRKDVHSHGLNNVHLTGFISNSDLPRWQAACDVLLMPYQVHVAASSGGDIGRYLSPMKLFEYLACGRAILSSDLPVLREVLNPENALLLPAQDATAWMNALQSLSADPGRREDLARRARQDAARYTWESRAALILADLDIK